MVSWCMYVYKDEMLGERIKRNERVRLYSISEMTEAPCREIAVVIASNMICLPRVLLTEL